MTPSVTRAEICFNAPTDDIWDAEDVRFNMGTGSVRGAVSWQGDDGQGRQCIEALFPVAELTGGTIENRQHGNLPGL